MNTNPQNDQQALPDNSDELAILYEVVIQHHQEYLNSIHTAFNDYCDKIKGESHDKLHECPKDDEESKKEVFQSQKEALTKALSEFKSAVSKSEHATREKLEEIQDKMDLDGETDLDTQLEEAVAMESE